MSQWNMIRISRRELFSPVHNFDSNSLLVCLLNVTWIWSYKFLYSNFYHFLSICHGVGSTSHCLVYVILKRRWRKTCLMMLHIDWCVILEVSVWCQRWSRSKLLIRPGLKSVTPWQPDLVIDQIFSNTRARNCVKFYSSTNSRRQKAI